MKFAYDQNGWISDQAESEVSAAGSGCLWVLILSWLCGTEAVINVHALLLSIRVHQHVFSQTQLITCLFFSSVQSKRWAPEESKLHINVSDNTEVQLEILQTGTATGPTNSSTFIRASLDNLFSGVSGYRYSKFPLQLSNSMCPLYLNDLVIRAFAWKVGGYPCSRSG